MTPPWSQVSALVVSIVPDPTPVGSRLCKLLTCRNAVGRGGVEPPTLLFRSGQAGSGYGITLVMILIGVFAVVLGQVGWRHRWRHGRGVVSRRGAGKEEIPADRDRWDRLSLEGAWRADIRPGTRGSTDLRGRAGRARGCAPGRIFTLRAPKQLAPHVGWRRASTYSRVGDRTGIGRRVAAIAPRAGVPIGVGRVGVCGPYAVRPWAPGRASAERDLSCFLPSGGPAWTGEEFSGGQLAAECCECALPAG
ncbi:hypothetical protein HEB94_000924 [Actinopolymorpha pittospori]|uniref:Uncharacterized protein n=1 Tax=Actinopolymorpha pittospori TaxID=648752 RepID=A0A927MPM6_9ACTN|nr:hypothetical protein [Actinopolymorpha pittospori]